MYERIMGSRNNQMFFTLINDLFPENRSTTVNKLHLSGNESSGLTSENEWMQEYYIIYNSYILETKESLHPDEE